MIKRLSKKYRKYRGNLKVNKFRNECLNLLKYSRNIPIKDISVNSEYETIYFDTRKLPHVEFLIRNLIYKFGSEWSHTIVTGTENYDYMKNMCFNISEKIKVIKLDYPEIITNYIYQSIKTSINFYKLFRGEKLFLWCEDTIVLKQNIKDFLKYDYIGPPYPKKWGFPDDYANAAINIRTKSVILDCLNKVKYYQDEIIDSKSRKITNNPEDIYFPKNIKKYNLGLLATRDVQSKFGIEHTFYEDPLCIHCIWNVGIQKNDKNKIFRNLVSTGKFNYLLENQ
uniref:DUF5672 domain-containing protein n=1 Tax=viral metagenome TaxID=1070528 RepID=A0A6C0IV78_9ZZZZ